MSDKTKKEPKAAKKEKPAKKKELLVTRYEIRTPETDKAKALAKRLLDPSAETQASTLLKFVKSQGNPTFADILAFMRASEPGKTVKTLEANYRWHCSDLKKKGVLKATSEREEVKQ